VAGSDERKEFKIGVTQFNDQGFVNQLLEQAPGIDPNDPRVRAAMGEAEAKKEEDMDEDKEEKK